jgi:glycerophosphoryl diester phosphodiesterase
MRFILPIIIAILALASCGQPADPNAPASTDAPAADSALGQAESAAAPAAATGPLYERLDCLRTSGGLLLIGHRGGPTRDYPENALETLERTLKAGTRAMEVDVSETKDGRLVLMHDDDLERTTTGTGLVADHTLAEIQELKLETGSKLTDFAPPTLDAALEWAVKNNAILELDKKRAATYPPIIAAVRAAQAENNVFIITYTDDQAVEVHTLAPELMITATVNSIAQFDDLVARGVKQDRFLAWTGNIEPRPELWSALATKGVESIFGTNGSRAEGLDYRFWDDDNGAEFNQLAADGLPILVTSLTDKTARQLAPEIRKAASCGF